VGGGHHQTKITLLHLDLVAHEVVKSELTLRRPAREQPNRASQLPLVISEPVVVGTLK
jgi:hypothetical protein